MSIIQNLIDIMAARYGQDVRQSIHDGIAECYADVSTSKTIADIAATNADSKAILANNAAINATLVAQTALSHPHGGITNDGKVGTVAALPLITGVAGVVQAGAFGTAAGTFAQGNDARLSTTSAVHSHGNITNDGKVGTVADLPLMTGAGGLVVAKTMAEAISIWKFTNPNLLHNWDFPNPANQRGVSGTINPIVPVYFYDRWIASNAPIVLNAGHIAMDGALYSIIGQRIEGSGLAGKTITASVMINNVVTSISATFPVVAGAQVQGNIPNFGFIWLNSTSGYTLIEFGATTSTRNVQAVKLELGNISTLAYDPPMDYGVELAKCKRYFRLWTTDAARSAALNEVALMRVAAPTTGTIVIGGTTYYYASANL